MRIIVAAVLLMASSNGFAAEWTDNADIQKLFSDAEEAGTFVLYDVAEDKLVGFDRARAETRFIPASTFKVPHTLIGLAEGVVADVDEVLPYGGEPQPILHGSRICRCVMRCLFQMCPFTKGSLAESRGSG